MMMTRTVLLVAVPCCVDCSVARVSNRVIAAAAVVVVVVACGLALTKMPLETRRNRTSRRTRRERDEAEMNAEVSHVTRQ